MAVRPCSGLAAADEVIYRTTGPNPDGRMTPIGVSTQFATLPPGPGMLPPFAAPQTPWVGNVRRSSWRESTSSYPTRPRRSGATSGSMPSTRSRHTAEQPYTVAQTNIAKFELANVVRQYGSRARYAPTRSLNLLEKTRLSAMVNLVGADALGSALYAKYHYLFWRPVTAINPTAVIADGFGPVPGYDDGNPATVEEPGWRPLLTTPNHPNTPARTAWS